MTTTAFRPRAATAFAAVLCGLALTACGGNAEPSGSPASSTPHGYVEGAEEGTEPQLRLVVADGDGRGVRVVDLLTEEVTDLPGGESVTGAVTDGRFAFLAGDGRTRVVDSGAWTVEHGDHNHYYRTQPGRAGVVDGTVTGAWSDSAVTALAREDGTTVLLDREKLEAGEVGECETIDGIAVPYEQHLVVAGDDGLVVRERDGGTVADVDATCARPAHAAATSHGVVFGCADGAVLVGEDDGEFTAEHIPYPEDGPDAATFHQRPGSETLGAVGGRQGAWILDTGEGAWTFVRSGPAAAVVATGADGPLLVLTEDGVLHAYDAETGEETATAPLLDGGAPDGVTITADTNRAYVNDPAASTVHEIDYHDDLRVARTFDVDVTPSQLVEAGR
ncbi:MULTISPECIES: YncE family protein [Prauserella salsuginis group]|uniref:YncE family protein n=1 Tax=Prauserella salsuginis TaxID=387889 RepID=A0ABW6GAD0_9PSEU|nr:MULTISPECIES: hypothetical protein [Prauserella salsuginis group]